MEEKLFDKNISLESKLPLHHQILMILKRNIASNTLREGDQLPTEEELCSYFNVSRSTIRNAIGALETEGIVTRIRGKGTFITQGKLKRKMEKVYSFSHEMRSLGFTPSSKLLDFNIIKPDRELAKLFEISEDDDVYKITRLRMANGEPLLVETTCLPYKLFPGLDKNKLESCSLYEMLRDDAKVIPYIADETYESVKFDSHIASVLDCRSHNYGFYIERITRQANMSVYEFTQSYMRGDRSKIEITLQQDIYTFNRNIE